MQTKFLPDDETQRRKLQEYIFNLEDACETAEALSSEHQQLKHSMEILLTVLEGSAHGITLVRNNQFKWVNQGFTRVLGWSFEELCGCGFERIFTDKEESERINEFIFSDLQKQKIA